MRFISMLALFFVTVVITSGATATEQTDPVLLYKQNCGACHGMDRLGSVGPALLPENLKRLRKKNAVKAIQNGRPATQMPAFAGKLKTDQIQALVDYIYTPLKEIPVWGAKEIKASHVIHHKAGSLGDKPVFKADPLNLFIVVELGDHHATVLDGDKLEPIHRFKTRFALHGGPKYSPDGRYVYFASRDGWISKYDIYNLKVVAEIRAGINTRNAAVSGDGRYIIVGNYLPHNLVILKASDMSLSKVIPVRGEGEEGKTSRVSAVYTAAPRESFVVALKDIPEVWEIFYTDDHEPVHNGWVHDYREDEGDTVAFPVRKIFLDDYLDDFMFDQSYTYLMGAARNAKTGQVVDMDLRRKVAELDLTGLPHLGSGITWEHKGRTVFATPNLQKGEVSIIDMESWKTIKRIKTLGPGFFMRSHEKSPYAWVDVFFGPDKDAVHVIDKRTLEIVKTLRPAPGKTAAHVEFDRYGRYALLSIWDMDGALVIYDAKTLEEIKRIPMKKPSGKYNVYNKINLSSGTSH